MKCPYAVWIFGVCNHNSKKGKQAGTVKEVSVEKEWVSWSVECVGFMLADRKPSQEGGNTRKVKLKMFNPQHPPLPQIKTKNGFVFLRCSKEVTGPIVAKV